MLEMQSDAGGCDTATRDFLEVPAKARVHSFTSFFNGIIRRLQPVPSSFYLFHKRYISVYENMTSSARGTIRTNFIPR